jgi:hypothetical protein
VSSQPQVEKPLARAQAEARLEGTVALGVSMLLGAVAVAVAAHPVKVLAGFVFAAVFFGAIMYVTVGRRYLRDALEGAREISTHPIETPKQTTRRAAARSAYINLPVAAFFALLLLVSGTEGSLIGIVAGNGLAFLALARTIRRWEATHSVQILREPRWRWRREHGHRGRGVIDPQDFYYVRNDDPVPGSRAAGLSGTLPSHG